MPIFIQALPLSLATFWRYLIFLPVIAIGAIFLSLFSLLPIIGLLVPGMVGVWMTVMGLRCALAARGHVQPLDGGTLLTVCLFFSVIFAGVGMVVNGVVWLIVSAMQLAGVELDPIGLFVGLFGISPYWTATLLAILAPMAIANAAFAVPLTAAAAATEAKGWDYKAFAGFGYGIIGLAIVSAIWLFSGHMYAIFGEIWAMFGLVFVAFNALAAGEALPFATDLSPLSALRSVLIMTWASSWYFATAVLTWERFAETRPINTATESVQKALTTNDIRALRQSRMGKSRPDR